MKTDEKVRLEAPAPPRRYRSTGTKLADTEMMSWEKSCAAAGVKPSEKIRDWILSWCSSSTS